MPKHAPSPTLCRQARHLKPAQCPHPCCPLRIPMALWHPSRTPLPPPPSPCRLLPAWGKCLSRMRTVTLVPPLTCVRLIRCIIYHVVTTCRVGTIHNTT